MSNRVLHYKPSVVRAHAKDYPWAILEGGQFRIGYATLAQAIAQQSARVASRPQDAFTIDPLSFRRYLKEQTDLAAPYLPETVI